MKKRSLTKITFLTIITLGLYELVWVAQTRNEMVAKYGAKIPSAIYAVAVRLLQLIGFVAVVVIVLYAMPTSNRNNQRELDNRVQPAAVCFGQYNQSTVCKNQIDSYYAPLPFDAFDWFGVALAILFVSFLLYLVFMRRWVTAYGVAVQKVTKQPAAGLIAVVALGGVIPILGMTYVQSSFNQISVK